MPAIVVLASDIPKMKEFFRAFGTFPWCQGMRDALISLETYNDRVLISYDGEYYTHCQEHEMDGDGSKDAPLDFEAEDHVYAALTCDDSEEWSVISYPEKENEEYYLQFLRRCFYKHPCWKYTSSGEKFGTLTRLW